MALRCAVLSAARLISPATPLSIVRNDDYLSPLHTILQSLLYTCLLMIIMMASTSNGLDGILSIDILPTTSLLSRTEIYASLGLAFMAALRAYPSALHSKRETIAYDLQLLQISLSSSIDPPHGFSKGVGNVLNILHRPLVMSENDRASFSAKSTSST